MTAFLDLGTARARAESLMTSTCTIRVKSTGQTTDPNTGAVTDVPGSVIYSGRCRVRPVTTRGGGTSEVGGAEAFIFDYLVALPFSATGVREGMPCHIDSSLDPDAIGLTLEIQKVDRGEHISARRLSCNEVA